MHNPQASGDPLARVGLERGGLATSGDYERSLVVDGVRLSHNLVTSTGWPMRGLASVSVVADTCLLAVSFATIALLKGAAGRGGSRTSVSVPSCSMPKGGPGPNRRDGHSPFVTRPERSANSGVMIP